MVATPPVELDPRAFNPPGDTVRRVVVLGRLSPWKGQDLFLRAFAEVFGDAMTKAYIVGGALFGESDYQRELVLEAQRLGIADRVQFVGHVEDPWAWLVDADVLVHGSRIPEPFGRVVVAGHVGAMCGRGHASRRTGRGDHRRCRRAPGRVRRRGRARSPPSRACATTVACDGDWPGRDA